MSGNVFEWCWDWYGEDYYTACQNQGLVFDPHGPPQGKNKVLRGGAWNAQDYACKTTYRDYALAFYRSNNYGFRIVQVEDF